MYLYLVFVVKFENLHKLRSEISVVEGFNLSAYQTFIQQVEHTSNYTIMCLYLCIGWIM